MIDNKSTDEKKKSGSSNFPSNWCAHSRLSSASVRILLPIILLLLSSPVLARFLEADPAREFHNPYSYVGNNPVRFTDSTGMVLDEAEALKNPAYRYAVDMMNETPGGRLIRRIAKNSPVLVRVVIVQDLDVQTFPAFEVKGKGDQTTYEFTHIEVRLSAKFLETGYFRNEAQDTGISPGSAADGYIYSCNAIDMPLHEQLLLVIGHEYGHVGDYLLFSDWIPLRLTSDLWFDLRDMADNEQDFVEKLKIGQRMKKLYPDMMKWVEGKVPREKSADTHGYQILLEWKEQNP